MYPPDIRNSNKRAGRQIQRFEGPEHEKLGNATGLEIDIGDGVVLTWGQVVAIAGDEFASLSELQESAKTAEGKARIRAALEHAEVPGSAVSSLPAPSEEQQQAHLGEYFKLASENVSHFVPGEAALGEWYKSHGEAIELALQAGLATKSESNALDLNQAYATEAFGQHFLTDMFSGGHIRVPRGEILDWYTSDFGPAVVDTMISSLRERLVEGIYRQIAAQSRKARWFEGTARNKIRKALNEMIDEAVAGIGGKAKLAHYLGVVVGGIISKALHDLEGRRGVAVSSEAQPVPWRAFGDDRLKDSPENEAQAKQAVLAAVQEIQLAYSIGAEESSSRQDLPEPNSLPDRVLFGFNSSDVNGPDRQDISKAGAYLVYHPDSHLELQGHTDPIGSEDFNDGLGTRRAEAVAEIVRSAGVDPGRVKVTSHGESQLVTKKPKEYARNRRVEFVWSNQASTGPDNPEDVAVERAREKVKQQIGPPYRGVERFLPIAVETAPGTTGPNPELPDWRWGSLPDEVRNETNSFVGKYLAEFRESILKNEALNAREVEGHNVEPRPIVESLLQEIGRDPVGFLSTTFGRSAGK